MLPHTLGAHHQHTHLLLTPVVLLTQVVLLLEGHPLHAQ